MTKIITIASFKGGVAKTTTAIHLAHCLSLSGHQVLLADGDRNRTASEWGQRGKPKFQICDNDNTPSLDGFDYLIIDTQGGAPDEDVLALANASHLLLLPTTPDAFAIEAMVKTTALLGQIGEKARIVITVTPPKPSKAGLQAQEALRTAGLTVCNRMIRRYAAYTKAAAMGCTVDQVKSDGMSGIAFGDYKTLTEELVSYGL